MRHPPVMLRAAPCIISQLSPQHTSPCSSLLTELVAACPIKKTKSKAKMRKA